MLEHSEYSSFFTVYNSILCPIIKYELYVRTEFTDEYLPYTDTEKVEMLDETDQVILMGHSLQANTIRDVQTIGFGGMSILTEDSFKSENLYLKAETESG